MMEFNYGGQEAIKHLQKNDYLYAKNLVETIFSKHGEDAAKSFCELIQMGTKYVDKSAHRSVIDNLNSLFNNFDYGKEIPEMYVKAISFACENTHPQTHRDIIDLLLDHKDPLDYALCIYKLAPYIEKTEHRAMIDELTLLFEKQSFQGKYSGILKYISTVTEIMEKIGHPKVNMAIFRKARIFGEYQNLDNAVKYVEQFRREVPDDIKINSEEELNRLINTYINTTVVDKFVKTLISTPIERVYKLVSRFSKKELLRRSVRKRKN